MAHRRSSRPLRVHLACLLSCCLTLGAEAARRPPVEMDAASKAQSAVPAAGIAVAENALGDVVRDGTADIRDLLRLRDIVAGRPPAATVYERLEGDLNTDGDVTAADVDVMRDVLLMQAGVPHRVDAAGGTVHGGRRGVQ
jgi:hypothetical protein